jgi:hypothetical protein
MAHHTVDEQGRTLIVGDPHAWFAWYPVWSLDAGWMWLRYVERYFSSRYNPGTGWMTEVVVYRPLPQRI